MLRSVGCRRQARCRLGCGQVVLVIAVQRNLLSGLCWMNWRDPWRNKVAAVLRGAMGKASAKTGAVGWGERDRDRSQHHGWGPRAACTEPHTQEDPTLGSTFRCRHLKIPNNFLIELGQWGMCVGRRDAHHVSFHIPRHRSLTWHSRSPARGIPVGPLRDRRSSSEHQGSRSRLRPLQAEFPTAPRDRASRQNQNLLSVKKEGSRVVRKRNSQGAPSSFLMHVRSLCHISQPLVLKTMPRKDRNGNKDPDSFQPPLTRQSPKVGSAAACVGPMHNKNVSFL